MHRRKVAGQTVYGIPVEQGLQGAAFRDGVWRGR